MKSSRAPKPPVPPESAAANDKCETFAPVTVFQVQLGIESNATPEETLVYDELRNRYFRLNATGAFIWRMVQAGSNVGHMAMQLEKSYGLDVDTANDVLSEFMRELLRLEVVIVAKDK